MNAVELPIYLVALGEEWVGVNDLPPNSVFAFGNKEGAMAFAAQWASQGGAPAAAYRICEYKFSGKVFEG